MIVLANVW